MLARPNVLNIRLIEESVASKKIYYFDFLDSTNSWLIKNGQCGDICISEVQTAGRGRRGNSWESAERGNIYFSLQWCFTEVVDHWSLLGLVVGVAVVKALKDIGLSSHGIKWPNDIFCGGKKLGGILLETVDQSGKVVIGVGLNIYLPEVSISQPVTAIKEILHDATITREILLIHLITRLNNSLNTFESLDFDEFLGEWGMWDILRGKKIRFIHQGLEIKGEVDQIDKHGRLGIIKETGERCFYSSIDIKAAMSKDNL